MKNKCMYDLQGAEEKLISQVYVTKNILVETFLCQKFLIYIEIYLKNVKCFISGIQILYSMKEYFNAL